MNTVQLHKIPLKKEYRSNKEKKIRQRPIY